MFKVSTSHLAALLLVLMAVFGCKAPTSGDLRPTPTPPPPSTGAIEARSYFNSKVKPAFETGSCKNCHKFIFQGGTASMGIYEYDSMRALLSEGGGAGANSLVVYVRGLDGHAFSADPCNGSFNKSPCQELAVWYQKEFGVGTGAGLPPLGAVESISPSGMVLGWAQDIDEPTRKVTVEIYVDGVRGIGDFAGTAIADKTTVLGVGGQTGFEFQLPDPFRNKVSHPVYLYGVDTESSSSVTLLKNAPMTNKSYLPSASTIATYNSSVRAFINANSGSKCVGCHALNEFDFDNAFYTLMLVPAPPGGSATNNTLYNKLKGHTGGNFCGAAPTTTTPCKELIQVYNEAVN